MVQKQSGSSSESGAAGSVNIYERLRDFQGINHVYGFRKLKGRTCKEILPKCSEAIKKTKNLADRRETSIIILDLSNAISNITVDFPAPSRDVTD